MSRTEPLGNRATSQSNLPYASTGALLARTNPFPHTRGNNMEENKNKKNQEQGEEQRRTKRASETSSEGTPERTVVEVQTDHDSDISVGTQGTTGSISVGMQSIGLQGEKKKLSGAQQRKLNRERKMAEGTWTKKKPPKKTSATSKPLKEGKQGGETREGQKRPRAESKTPPQATKRPRSGMQTGTYSEAASELRMAVIDRRHPEITLDQGQADLIQNRLLDALDDAPSGSDNPVQFTRASYSGCWDFTQHFEFERSQKNHVIQKAHSAMGVGRGAVYSIVPDAIVCTFRN